MILCKTHKGGHHVWWRWRQIDGKTCWYEGKLRVDKSQLTWAMPVRKHYTDAELKELTPDEPIVPLPVLTIPEWSAARVAESFSALIPLQEGPVIEPVLEQPKRINLGDLALVGGMFAVILAALTVSRAFKHLGRFQ